MTAGRTGAARKSPFPGQKEDLLLHSFFSLPQPEGYTSESASVSIHLVVFRRLVLPADPSLIYHTFDSRGKRGCTSPRRTLAKRQGDRIQRLHAESQYVSVWNSRVF